MIINPTNRHRTGYGPRQWKGVLLTSCLIDWNNAKYVSCTRLQNLIRWYLNEMVAIMQMCSNYFSCIEIDLFDSNSFGTKLYLSLGIITCSWIFDDKQFDNTGNSSTSTIITHNRQFVLLKCVRVCVYGWCVVSHFSCMVCICCESNIIYTDSWRYCYCSLLTSIHLRLLHVPPATCRWRVVYYAQAVCI